MKANFLRLREFIINEFPGQWENIEGDNYPAPEWTKTAATVMSAVQMFVMVAAMMGDSLWNFIPGFRNGPPQFYYAMKENPAMTLIMLFLVVPSFVQSYVNSGGEFLLCERKYWILQIINFIKMMLVFFDLTAFEVFLDGKLVSLHSMNNKQVFFVFFKDLCVI